MNDADQKPGNENSGRYNASFITNNVVATSVVNL